MVLPDCEKKHIMVEGIEVKVETDDTVLKQAQNEKEKIEFSNEPLENNNMNITTPKAPKSPICSPIPSTLEYKSDMKKIPILCSSNVLRNTEAIPTESVQTTSSNLPKSDSKTLICLKNRLSKGTSKNGTLLCVVCMDRASGYHYGVPSCEGCKAFFKRSLQLKQLNYKCPANNSCTIDKMSRKCCQACRLRKCQEVGMSKDYLGNKIKRPRKDHDGKLITKNKRFKNLENANECLESVLTSVEIEHENTIQSLVKIHAKLYLDTDDVVHGIPIKQFCDTISKQLVQVIDWAKLIPGYSDLLITDQAILLQKAWLDLLVLNWIFLSINSTDSIRFSNYLDINKKETLEFGFDGVCDQIMTVVKRVKSYNIDEEEISCLKAIALTARESCSLSDMAGVQRLNIQFSSSLQYYSKNRYRNNQLKFAKLILLLPQLKIIVHDVISILNRICNQRRMLFSDLLIEMLEAKQKL